jgi:hypothetical protein
MFFKKGLRDSFLIRKLTMKNPRMSEKILAIINKYALAEEVTIDTRDQKKDKELGHSDQPITSKSNDKKSNSYEPKRKHKLTAREVLAVSPTTPAYLKWSEVPITFDHSDHPDFIPKPGRYPLIICPIVKDVKLNRVLIDGGSSLNILFLKTFD